MHGEHTSARHTARRKTRRERVRKIAKMTFWVFFVAGWGLQALQLLGLVR